MNSISIVYIDDINDIILSKYMEKTYCSKNYRDIKKDYKEIQFKNSMSYEDLLRDNVVRSANVILIDNHLFEERAAHSGRFSGKQFKVILRKLLPFVEVVIITADETIVEGRIVRKHNSKQASDPNVYYDSNLACLLDEAIDEVLEFKGFAADLIQSLDVERMLIEKIQNSIQGNDSYDSLTTQDVNELINTFKELKRSVEQS